MKFRKLIQALAACLLIAAIVGCGSSEHVGRVTGTVRCGGAPLSLGSVLFESAAGVCLGAVVDGKFTLTHQDQLGIPPGIYRVSVVPPPPKVEADPQTTQLRTVSTVDESLFPLKYRNPETSGLTLEVKAGTNVFPIELSRE